MGKSTYGIQKFGGIYHVFNSDGDPIAAEKTMYDACVEMVAANLIATEIRKELRYDDVESLDTPLIWIGRNAPKKKAKKSRVVYS
jgi:hypothetical protein